jgi:hypothetical protein
VRHTFAPCGPLAHNRASFTLRVATAASQAEKRYGCQVIPDASVSACEAAAARLESSVSPARIAELANGPAAVLKRPGYAAAVAAQTGSR